MRQEPTKEERREKRRRKARSWGVSGRSVMLLWNLVTKGKREK